MKASTLITILKDIQETNGDIEIFVYEEDGHKRLNAVDIKSREFFQLNGIDIKEKTAIVV